MLTQTEKSSTCSSGGKYTVAPEALAGLCGLLLAVFGQMTPGGYDVFLADSVISGMVGIFGAFALANPVGLARDLHKIISILVGAGFASILGPLLAAWGEFRFEWLRPFGYLNDAAAGLIIGLITSPCLAFLRNPLPAVTAAMALLPVLSFGKKKDN